MKDISKYNSELIRLKESGNFRTFPELAESSIVDLSSNDYLGLAQDEQLKQEFLTNVDLSKLEFSASSSRLLAGNSIEYDKLEQLLAAQYQREACLIFNSGYHANTGILPALAQKGDLIIADKLVHASLIDGMQLSKADFIRFNHLNYEHLVQILEKKAKNHANIFIVSESIFSMDGDKADLAKLVEIKKRFNAFLYLDEAHAVGTNGKNGFGCAEEDLLLSEIDFIIGTFGKALASVGAFVICDTVFKQYLINKARTLIFTTALPPINLAWTKFIMTKLPSLNDRRKQLEQLSTDFSNLLQVKSDSHIIPFIIGENKAAIQTSQDLKNIGFNVLPIRYPTVPKNTARLRFSLNANITTDQLKPIKKLLIHD